MDNLWQNISTLISSMAVGAIAVLSMPQGSFAQSTLPACEPPAAAEFLVLVFTDSEAKQNDVRLQVGKSLPKNHDLMVCEYGGNVLSRVGDFDSLTSATKWAEYVGTATSLPLMVITPVGGEMPRTSVINPPTIPASTTTLAPDLVVETMPELAAMTEPPAFQPKALSGGYGILVDYGANPAIATQLKTVLGKDVGLVVYASRGYLLAEQTPDADRVLALLNLLNQNNLTAIAVPAEQLMLLRATVTP